MKRSAPFEDRDDYELMRNLNQQYESNFLRFQKLWFGQDSDQLAELKENIRKTRLIKAEIVRYPKGLTSLFGFMNNDKFDVSGPWETTNQDWWNWYVTLAYNDENLKRRFPYHLPKVLTEGRRTPTHKRNPFRVLCVRCRCYEVSRGWIY